jgi:hypothetical protein
VNICWLKNCTLSTQLRSEQLFWCLLRLELTVTYLISA